MDATREQLLEIGRSAARQGMLQTFLAVPQDRIDLMPEDQKRWFLSRRDALINPEKYDAPQSRRVVSADMIAAFGPFVG